MCIASGIRLHMSIYMVIKMVIITYMHADMYIHTSSKPIPYMGPGPGRAHALSKEGCQGPGQGPRPGRPGPDPAALLAEHVGPARAWAHIHGYVHGYMHASIHGYINGYMHLLTTC